MTLSVDQLTVAEAMWRAGKTSGQIALHLNVTRNTICGVAARRNWPAHNHVGNSGNKGSAPRKRSRKSPPKHNWFGGPPIERLPTKPKVIPVPSAARPVTILARQPCQCAWPLDEGTSGPATLFCGAPVERGSYCVDHNKAAWQPEANKVRWDRRLSAISGMPVRP